MQRLPITFHPSQGEVKIHRIFDCEFCNDTGRIESIDWETGYGTGYYKPCFNCTEPTLD